MKLQIKHLAPYLPYGLTAINYIGKTVEIKGLQKGSDSVSNELWVWQNKNLSYSKGYLYECKPIFHPLSNLTKEIEGIGVPIIEMAKLFHKSDNYAVTHYENINEYNYQGDVRFSVNCCVENDSFRYTYYQLRAEILKQSYFEIKKLIEWRFDVFGLIEIGLAVDINTIENE